MNCPRCRTTLHPTYTFCPQCNLPLRGQSGINQAQPGAYPPQSSPNLQPGAYPQANMAPAASYPPQSALPGAFAAQANAAPYYPGPLAMQAHAAPAVGLANLPRDPRAPGMPRSTSAEEKRIASNKQGEEQEGESENERLLIFSDAIIAFAITIAAVPLKIPKDLSQLKANSAVFFIELVCYIVGFFLVYGLWRDHHSIFHHLKRNNTWLIVLNTLFLALIVFIPVGFIVTISGGLGSPGKPSPDALQIIGQGALIFLGATFFASVTLLLIWVSARMRPSALFGVKKPEKPFLIYMTRRLVLRLFSFVAYTSIFFLVLSGAWVVALSIFVALFAVQILFLGLYRRRYQDVLHVYLGREETTRLQLFSDAIFAIAITITVAQIDPAAKAEEIWSLVGTFIFSLLFLVVFWLLHYRIFRYVRRLNATLIALNFWFLLLVILDFMTARLYTSHMYESYDGMPYSVPFSIYQLLITSTLFIMWQYAQRHHPRQEKEPSLIKKQLTQRQTRRLSWVVIANPFIFLFLAIAACFTPIFTTLYVIIYLALLGSAWLVGILATLHLPVQNEQETSLARQ